MAAGKMYAKKAGAWQQVHPHVAPTLPYLAGTGGTVAEYTSAGKFYRAHTFLAGGTFTVTQGAGGRKFEYLLVAGGGQGGSRHSGGGGGGGVLPGEITLANGAYPVVVGAGGSGAVMNSHAGNNGADSTAFGLTAKGGGGGAGYNDGGSVPTGNNGGCGGGSGAAVGLSGGGSSTPGRGTVGQGYDGGIGSQTSGQWAAGGGGGAGQAGSNAAQPVGGKGGDGYQSSISGTAKYYGGGGKGPGKYSASDATPGTANTGGGSGGTRDGTPVAGGSGIVIVRYEIEAITPFTPNAATGGNTTVDVPNYNGTGETWRVHTFTASGTLTVTAASNPFRCLIQAGGGAGGGVDNANHGGGGDGGYGTDASRTLPTGAVAVVVGGGGAPVGWGYNNDRAGSGGVSSLGAFSEAGGIGGAARTTWDGATHGPVSNIVNGVANVQYGAGSPSGQYYTPIQASSPNIGMGGMGGRNADPQTQGAAGGSGIVVVAYRIA